MSIKATLGFNSQQQRASRAGMQCVQIYDALALCVCVCVMMMMKHYLDDDVSVKNSSGVSSVSVLTDRALHLLNTHRA